MEVVLIFISLCHHFLWSLSQLWVTLSNLTWLLLLISPLNNAIADHRMIIDIGYASCRNKVIVTTISFSSNTCWICGLMLWLHRLYLIVFLCQICVSSDFESIILNGIIQILLSLDWHFHGGRNFMDRLSSILYILSCFALPSSF